MSGGGKQARKQAYFEKLLKLLEEYTQIIVVTCDNVGSSHMQEIRKALRPYGAVLLMGKNTLVRKVIKGQIPKNPSLELLLPLVWGNVGFVFAKGELPKIRDLLVNKRVAAPAKAGTIAPCDVVVKAGPTGMEPTQTSFLQALNIASKITRGQIEIINDVNLIKKGDKVGSSEAALLQKLDQKPFTYGLNINSVYDNGSVYSAEVLDLTDEAILDRFRVGVQNIAAVGLSLGLPNVATVSHSLANAYKNLLAVSLATEYTFERAKKLKEAIKNPGAFAAPAAAAAPAAGKKDAKEEKKKEEKKEEPVEDDTEMVGGLFD
jgi:large subunit ribosomal protein LP0